MWCDKLATACSVTASVVNYLKYKYFKYVFEIHIEYFVFEINYKSILYFLSEVKSIWQKYFKYNFDKYFVFNTLPKSIFYNCGDGDRHVGIYASPDNWRTCFYFILILFFIVSLLFIISADKNEECIF